MTSASLRILILSPRILPYTTGNALTVERWRRLLAKEGISVTCLATEGLSRERLIDAVDGFDPHIVHCHHVLKAGECFLDSGPFRRYRNLRLVVSPAGTDISEGAVGEQRETVLSVLRQAQAIVCQNDWLPSWLDETEPSLLERTCRVPKSVLLQGCEPFDLRTVCNWPRDSAVFFLPAGIRPIKGNLMCLEALAEIRREQPGLRAVFAGPILDEAYGRSFLDLTRRLDSFSAYLPYIPPEAMGAAYASADVILNASRSEGLSNVILEAMACGRPVLASDIPGNRQPLCGDTPHEAAGLLFRPEDRDDFRRQALLLLNNPYLRENLGRNGEKRIERFFRPDKEISGLLQAYDFALRNDPIHP